MEQIKKKDKPSKIKKKNTEYVKKDKKQEPFFRIIHGPIKVDFDESN